MSVYQPKIIQEVDPARKLTNQEAARFKIRTQALKPHAHRSHIKKGLMFDD